MQRIGPIFLREKPDLTGGLNLFQIQLLHLLARPRCSAQKLQAGFDAGVVRKAAHWHGGSHRFPAHPLR